MEREVGAESERSFRESDRSEQTAMTSAMTPPLKHRPPPTTLTRSACCPPTLTRPPPLAGPVNPRCAKRPPPTCQPPPPTPPPQPIDASIASVARIAARKRGPKYARRSRQHEWVPSAPSRAHPAHLRRRRRRRVPAAIAKLPRSFSQRLAGRTYWPMHGARLFQVRQHRASPDAAPHPACRLGTVRLLACARE